MIMALSQNHASAMTPTKRRETHGLQSHHSSTASQTHTHLARNLSLFVTAIPLQPMCQAVAKQQRLLVMQALQRLA